MDNSLQIKKAVLWSYGRSTAFHQPPTDGYAPMTASPPVRRKISKEAQLEVRKQFFACYQDFKEFFTTAQDLANNEVCSPDACDRLSRFIESAAIFQEVATPEEVIKRLETLVDITYRCLKDESITQAEVIFLGSILEERNIKLAA